MIFNSIEFFVFGILFFLFWPIFNKKDSFRWTYISICSLIFYGWWDWRFILLLVFSGIVDYICGLCIAKSYNYKRLFLCVSLTANLGLLSIFKYSDFILASIQDFISLFGIQIDQSLIFEENTFILPVGISFYTFQSLSYTLDIYQNRLKPVKNFFHFFAYLSMFPQLVAGPIIRAKDILQQLVGKRSVSDMQIWNGIKMIVFGLFQKMVIADNLAYMVDRAFESKLGADEGGTFLWWSVMIAFAFQIYCDFSGYSLIARGLGKLMGFHFRMNFNHPYISQSLREFWTRWHISLSSWFRDYVYIALGGNRKGLSYGIIFMWVSLLVSGLWHGASYNFIIWGSIHAFFLSIERITKWQKRITFKYKGPFLSVIIFLQAVLAWVYFRAESLPQANDILLKLFTLEASPTYLLKHFANNYFFLFLAIGIEMFIYIREQKRITRFWIKRPIADIAFVAGAIAMIILFRGEINEFIYFQF
jgi:D-alanyl-lipoteichoic acid acyltransferase DltB (MBOAT superfamily)